MINTNKMLKLKMPHYKRNSVIFGALGGGIIGGAAGILPGAAGGYIIGNMQEKKWLKKHHMKDTRFWR